MFLEIHYQSVETVYIPVRSEHPTTGVIDLSTLAVAVALPVAGVAPATWVNETWATGTIRRGDDRFFIVVVPINGFTIANDTTYQAWVRINGVGGAIVKAGTIKAIST